MKILFMGTPSFAVPILEALSKKYEISLVVSQPNRMKKKGLQVKTPVAEFAEANNLKLFQPESIKDDNLEIMSCDADILVTAAYGQYIPSFILNKNLLSSTTFSLIILGAYSISLISELSFVS